MKTKQTLTLQIFLLAFLFGSLLLSCKKDNQKPEDPKTDEEVPELLTSMILQFKDSSNATQTIMADFRDPDGPGGKIYTKFDTIKLNANKTYYLNIYLLDESKSPIDTISKEVWAERNDHQLFFNHSNLQLSSTYLDTDGNGLPVGLSSKWKTGNAGSGTSKITLKHQPGSKNGSITPGETDIEVTFQTKIN